MHQSSIPSATFDSTLYTHIRGVLLSARAYTRKTINNSMLQAYWQIGQLIVENEQGGLSRAEYGKGVLESLSLRLSEEFGKGFDARNLRNMRAFFLFIQIGTQCVPI